MLRIHSTTYARLPRNARRIPRLLSRYTTGAASPAPDILGYTPHTAGAARPRDPPGAGKSGCAGGYLIILQFGTPVRPRAPRDSGILARI